MRELLGYYLLECGQIDGSFAEFGVLPDKTLPSSPPSTAIRTKFMRYFPD